MWCNSSLSLNGVFRPYAWRMVNIILSDNPNAPFHGKKYWNRSDDFYRTGTSADEAYADAGLGSFL